MCTKNREKLFIPRISKRYGELMHPIVAAGLVPANEASMRNTLTDVVEETLTTELPIRFQIEIDFYVFMQDHLHMIVVLGDHKGRSYSLSQIIGAFKSLATRAMWKLGYSGRLFQPNFYEHIIRDENSLDRIRRYSL